MENWKNSVSQNSFIGNVNSFMVGKIFKNYWFTFYMGSVLALTMLMIVNVSNFQANSVDHYVILNANDQNKLEAVRRRLQDVTLQPVLVESIGENQYRIRLRCPPEKYDEISGWIFKKFKSE